MDAEQLAAAFAGMSLDRVTEGAQTDAVALVQAIATGDDVAAVLVLAGMTDAERLVACMALAASVAACAQALDCAPADLIKRQAEQ